MIRFECDYAEGAHPYILQRLIETNLEQEPGYGDDFYCTHAQALIRQFCGCENVDIHFIAGGTQANATVISAILRPFEAVIAAESGHIYGHEAGAIEARGHKVLPLPTEDGKITGEAVENLVCAYRDDHAADQLVHPGMVYISNSTETGTIYSKAELYALRDVCQRYHIPLYLDGARFGYALASPKNDLTPEDIAACCDIFYIGGTKIGALIGEAVVIVNDALKANFRSVMRQNGALLAKGRLLGIQFESLFTDDLYLQMSRHAVRLGMQIREACLAKGWALRYDSYTNQQFVILSIETANRLAEKYAFHFWEPPKDGKVTARFCTSWATREEQVQELVKDIQAM